MSGPLAVVGKVLSIKPIEGADRIQQASVDCGPSGTWSGVVGKEIEPGQVVTVFLQDALLPPNERWAFMKKMKWRVRMCRFKGVPSECLIVPGAPDITIGTDMTRALGVTKYEKPIPAGSVDILGAFPSWISKTDEDNFQRVPELVERMRDEPWYATEKADGTSATIWCDEDGLHVCARNFEMKEFTETGGTNVYWRAARKYQMEKLPAGFAVQCEVVGPGVQGNPMGLTDLTIRAFNVWNRTEHKPVPFPQIQEFCHQHGVPMARLVATSDDFKGKHDPGNKPWTPDELRALAQIEYVNRKPGEGIVIRAMSGAWSFKVINLAYRD
jgi:RNA ligase (TIGR02306 family)